MPESSLSAEAIGKLSPGELVDIVDQLDPTSEAVAQLDLDVIATAIDPKKLGKTEFVRLMAALDRLAKAGAAVNLADVGAETFAALIARASKDQVQGILDRRELREMVLDEIFLSRMPSHLRADRAAKVKAV